MLSYRHAFHAGNHADVLKHSILSRIILQLVRKEKPFTYIDSHAGAGMYDLDADWAKKTGEADGGIRLLLDASGVPALLEPYLDICRDLYAGGRQYPGSPEIVRALSRTDDQLTLMELHPAEIDILRANFSGESRIHIHHRDGFAGLASLCPPEPRRGLALVDPSYETAGDYIQTAETLLAVHERWPVGMLVLWYPLVGRRTGEIQNLKDRFYTSEIPGILTAELYVDTPDSEGYGLFGSGMLIIQPPWKLAEELEEMLPFLAEALGKNGNGGWKVEWINPAP